MQIQAILALQVLNMGEADDDLDHDQLADNADLYRTTSPPITRQAYVALLRGHASSNRKGHDLVVQAAKQTLLLWDCGEGDGGNPGEGTREGESDSASDLASSIASTARTGSSLATGTNPSSATGSSRSSAGSSSVTGSNLTGLSSPRRPRAGRRRRFRWTKRPRLWLQLSCDESTGHREAVAARKVLNALKSPALLPRVLLQ